MFDVLTIGSALVDIFVTSDTFTLEKMDGGVFLCQSYGAKIEVDSFKVHTGGGAGNVAVGLARAGFSVATIVETGRDSLAHFVISELRENHVDTDFIITQRHEETGGSVILVGEDGGRTVMVHRGASSQLGPEDINPDAVRRASWIHLSSIAGRLNTLETIAAQATEYSVPMSWNPGSAELALLSGGEVSVDLLPIQILVLNAQEWEKIKDIQPLLREKVPEIIVTNGAKGILLIQNNNDEAIQNKIQVTVTDETGAGDAFASGYLAARLQKKEPRVACEWGTTNAQSVIQHFGAKQGLLTHAQLALNHSSAS